MDRHESDRILEEWDAVARQAVPPAEAPRRRAVAFGRGTPALAPLIAAALVIAVGIAWLGGRETGPGATGSPSPSSDAAASAASDTPEPASATPALASATPEPASASPETCEVDIAITSWEGAAGSRIAEIAATNRGQIRCEIQSFARAQLIDGTGRVLAQTPDGLRAVALAPGDTVHAMASVANVCGEPPVAPVTIRLDFGANGVVDAQPLSPTDTTVPPCNGPGQPSDMSIQGWTR